MKTAFGTLPVENFQKPDQVVRVDRAKLIRERQAKEAETKQKKADALLEYELKKEKQREVEEQRQVKLEKLERRTSLLEKKGKKLSRKERNLKIRLLKEDFH